MKFVALLALVVSCGAPPDDVEEQHAAVQVSSPWGNFTPQSIYVGEDLTTGHSTLGHSGALYIRNIDGLCRWLSLDNGSGDIAQNTDIFGSYVDDVMIHQTLTSTWQCPGGISYTLGRVTVANTEIQVNLHGLDGNDALVCDGTRTAGWGKNSCFGEVGNDFIWAYDARNVVYGGDGNDAIKMVTNAVGAKAFGDAGDDCITRQRPGYQGTIDCGLGTDKVNSTLLGTVGCEALSTNNCGL